MRQNNFQVTAHANGDAAITQLINAVEISRNHSYKPVKVADYPFNFTNLDSERVVCIHCQCTTP
jgi:predicted amidohydrolase YtcJ